MLNESMIKVYNDLRLMHYNQLFEKLRENDPNLSATEAFAIDVIYLLGRPTVSQVAVALGISQPNATYRINSLSSKGYVKKTISEDDRRVCYVTINEEYFPHYATQLDFLNGVCDELKKQFDDEQLAAFEKMLYAVSEITINKIEGKK